MDGYGKNTSRKSPDLMILWWNPPVKGEILDKHWKCGFDNFFCDVETSPLPVHQTVATTYSAYTLIPFSFFSCGILGVIVLRYFAVLGLLWRVHTSISWLKDGLICCWIAFAAATIHRELLSSLVSAAWLW